MQLRLLPSASDCSPTESNVRRGRALSVSSVRIRMSGRRRKAHFGQFVDQHHSQYSKPSGMRATHVSVGVESKADAAWPAIPASGAQGKGGPNVKLPLRLPRLQATVRIFQSSTFKIEKRPATRCHAADLSAAGRYWKILSWQTSQSKRCPHTTTRRRSAQERLLSDLPAQRLVHCWPFPMTSP